MSCDHELANEWARCSGKTPASASAIAKKSEALEAARPIGAEAYPGFCSMKQLEVFLLPLDGMLVHRRNC